MKDKRKETLKDRLKAVSSDPDRLKYHLMADIGWISDPNGLVEHNGLVHIFHQYTPAEDLGLQKPGDITLRKTGSIIQMKGL
ncbi:hypothetical protein [Ileibacterium valens]|uniref:hypothetical protein n=2 Tax=Ileibacterium valens TaxID=1862668 RepID=UPI00334210BA